MIPQCECRDRFLLPQGGDDYNRNAARPWGVATHLIAVSVVLLLSGCQNTASAPLGESYLELTDGDEQGCFLRVVLVEADVAQVDICSRSPVGEERPRSFLLPTDRLEAARLIRMVDSLARTAPPEPAAEYPFAQTCRIIIRVRQAGRMTSVRLSLGLYLEAYDYVWQGIVEEVRSVGLVELALSILSQEDAEARAADGEIDEAVREYDVATSGFQAWALERCSRYGPGMIYEPGVGMEFHYPAKDGGQLYVSGDPGDRIDELPGVTPKWKLEFFRYKWANSTGRMHVRTVNGVRVVGFDIDSRPDSDRWVWGLPAGTIDADSQAAIRRVVEVLSK